MKAKSRRSGTGEKAREKSQRILGLELGGGKSGRTSLVLLEYYPKDKKVFVSERVPNVAATATRYGDEVLLDHLRKLKPARIGVNAPLSLPPCVRCRYPECGGYRECSYAPVRWMHEEAVRAKIPVLKHPTPYTQRPVDVFLRTRVQPRYGIDLFIEESLGAGRAPLAARMQYLQSQIGKKLFLETSPRLALVGIADWYGVTARELRRYRLPEDGVEHRRHILVKLQEDLTAFGLPQLFLYEAEAQEIAESLPCFQALLSGFMVVCADAGFLRDRDPDFEKSWSFVAIPRPRAEW